MPIVSKALALIKPVPRTNAKQACLLHGSCVQQLYKVLPPWCAVAARLCQPGAWYAHCAAGEPQGGRRGAQPDVCVARPPAGALLEPRQCEPKAFLLCRWFGCVVCIACPCAGALQTSASVLLALGGTLAALMRLWCAQLQEGSALRLKQLDKVVSLLSFPGLFQVAVYFCGMASLMSSVYNPMAELFLARAVRQGLDRARHAHAAAPQ